MSEFGKEWTIKLMRIERIEHFIEHERFLLSEGAFRLATGIASRRLRDGFPLGYLTPGDAAAAIPGSPLVIVPLTTVSIHPLATTTLAEAHELERRLHERLLRQSWSMYQRVAQELLDLLQYPKLVGTDRSLPAVRVTQQILADLVGVSRDSVAAELRDLVAAGAIRTEYGRVVVVDAPLLEQAARPVMRR